MRVTTAFTEEEYDKKKRVIIYGAGNYGEIALGGLTKMGIRADAFIDKNHAGKKYHGVVVKSPDYLKEYKNDIFLVASLNYFDEIVDLLIEEGVEHYYDIEHLMEICPDNFLNEYTLDEKKNVQKYKNVINNYNQGQLTIGHVEVVITERCTLKCKDCANLMQYYHKPENLDIEDIMKTFDNFIDSIDVLLEMRILGGEPFIVRDIDKLINHYVHNDKIKRITIYTNSTILPAKGIITSLKNDKVVVHMSNYGEKSRKLKDLKTILREEKVNYYIHEYSEWNDLGGLEERKYRDNMVRKLFSECLMAKCYTFYRGKLYLCPRSAHGEKIGAFKNRDSETLDFTNGKKSKEEITRLIKNTYELTACTYCNGSCVRSQRIPAAVQCK